MFVTNRNKTEEKIPTNTMKLNGNSNNSKRLNAKLNVFNTQKQKKTKKKNRTTATRQANNTSMQLFQSVWVSQVTDEKGIHTYIYMYVYTLVYESAIYTCTHMVRMNRNVLEMLNVCITQHTFIGFVYIHTYLHKTLCS